MAKKPELKSIRSAFLARGFSLARIGLKTSVLAAKGAFSTDSTNEQTEELKKYFLTEFEALTRELGELKGSLMKAGQMLSMYGEHLLPKEINEVLKSLQFQSPPVAWPVMQKVLMKEWGAEKLATLDIQTTPWAAASLGQVYRAQRKSDGAQLAIKIQYPGVDKAIDNDLRVLKTLFSLLHVLPKGPRFDQIFTEVREMLHQEVNYELEAQFTRQFAELLKTDDRYTVPQVYSEYSTRRVLVTSFLEGETIDGAAVAALSQERRNQIGESFLNLYMRELLQFGLVQTDPHLGNYRIAIDKHGTKDRLVLLDFGAVRKVPLEFLKSYHSLMLGGFEHDPEKILRGGRGLRLLLAEDPVELLKKYIQLCFLITEPFAKPETEIPNDLMTSDGRYDWGRSDLPRRVAKQATDIAISFRLRAPPHEIVFLDRKLGGTFVFLSVLKCQIKSRELTEAIIKNPPLLQDLTT